MSVHPLPFFRSGHPIWRRWSRLRQVSTFEKVIIANSAIILLATLAGWWITQHNPETYHYLIDTSFIALAALLGMVVNFLLLRAAFAPLNSLLATIRAVEAGNLEARASACENDADVVALARTFNAMLDRLELARHDAAGRVLHAQEEERRRLALELHDQTGQSLTALALHAEAIMQRLAGESSPPAVQARSQAAHLVGLAQRTLTEVQSLSRQLRPSLLDDLGLVAALRWLAEDAGQRLQVQVRVQVRKLLVSAQGTFPQGEPERLPADVETALFRIAQESLTNAVRHGQAHQIQMILRLHAARVTLTVVDNGYGFAYRAGGAPGTGRKAGSGLGMEGMRERAELLGGRLAVRSQPERGCVVRATIPLTGQ